jgi:hypothetical protein
MTNRWICIDRLPFPIISTDLWVGGNVPGAKDAGKTAKVQYVVGAAEGPIKFAELEFIGFNVTDQAFSAYPATLDRLRLTDRHICK